MRVVSLVFATLYTVSYVPILHFCQRNSRSYEYGPHSIVPLTPYLFPESGVSDEANRRPPERKPDGTFNGFPLFKVNSRPKTDIHCVGENFQEDRGWLFRSCRFESLCFDTKLEDFVVYPERPLGVTTNGEVWSSTHNEERYTTVPAGAQNKLWWPVLAKDRDGIKTPIGRYQPQFVYDGDDDDDYVDDIPTSYYRFNATWIPFFRHQRSAYNPGHLVWDDFLGIYTLLDIFDQADDNLMLTHMIRPATSDFDGDADLPNVDLINKFIPLMGEHNYDLQTLEGKYSLKLNNNNDDDDSNTRHVICADKGLIGSGLFSDHGDHHWHGHFDADYEYPHNHGRGGQFRRYRQWLMRNIGVDPNTPMQREPYLIVVSQSSSEKSDRAGVRFRKQIDSLKLNVGDRAIVKSVQLSKLSLLEQVALLSRTAVFVSVVGGATVTGTFLPKGASVILYTSDSLMLDWDFWNNFPQVKTHWFPKEKMNETLYIKGLVEVVQKQFNYLDAH